MRAVSWIAILVAVIVGWFLLTRGPKDITSAEQAATPVQEPISPNPVSQKIETATAGIKPSPSPIAVTTNSTEIPVPIPCKSLWADLRKIPAGGAGAGKAVSMPEGKDCPTLPVALPQQLLQVHQDYLKHCAGKSLREPTAATKEKGNEFAKCTDIAFHYRAFVSDWLTRDKPLSEISDPALLNDKLVAKFTTDPANAASVAERLLQIDPSNYGAAKVTLAGAVEKAMRAKPDGANSSQSVSDVEAQISRAERLQKGTKTDPDLVEAKILLAAKKSDVQAVQSYAEDLIKADPNSGRGYYHAAWVEYQRGNPEKMFQLLDQAVRLNPNDPRYGETLDRAHSIPLDKITDSGQKPSIFSGSINFELAPPGVPAR